MKIEKADEFQIFFPSDEARFFPEFPDGTLQEVFAGFNLAAEPFHLLTPKPRFLRPNKSFPSERTGKQSVVGRIVVLPLLWKYSCSFDNSCRIVSIVQEMLFGVNIALRGTFFRRPRRMLLKSRLTALLSKPQRIRASLVTGGRFSSSFIFHGP